MDWSTAKYWKSGTHRTKEVWLLTTSTATCYKNSYIQLVWPKCIIVSSGAPTGQQTINNIIWFFRVHPERRSGSTTGLPPTWHVQQIKLIGTEYTLYNAPKQTSIQFWPRSADCFYGYCWCWFVVKETLLNDWLISSSEQSPNLGFGTETFSHDMPAPFGWNYNPAEKHCWLIFRERKILFWLKKQAE
jgi:hypothetical protein